MRWCFTTKTWSSWVCRGKTRSIDHPNVILFSHYSKGIFRHCYLSLGQEIDSLQFQGIKTTKTPLKTKETWRLSGDTSSSQPLTGDKTLLFAKKAVCPEIFCPHAKTARAKLSWPAGTKKESAVQRCLFAFIFFSWKATPRPLSERVFKSWKGFFPEGFKLGFRAKKAQGKINSFVEKEN